MEFAHKETMDNINTLNEASVASVQSIAWSEICRICGNTSNHIVPIFEGEGAEHEISSKIHKHLPIKVRLHLYICNAITSLKVEKRTKFHHILILFLPFAKSCTFFDDASVC